MKLIRYMYFFMSVKHIESWNLRFDFLLKENAGILR